MPAAQIKQEVDAIQKNAGRIKKEYSFIAFVYCVEYCVDFKAVEGFKEGGGTRWKLVGPVEAARLWVVLLDGLDESLLLVNIALIFEGGRDYADGFHLWSWFYVLRFIRRDLSPHNFLSGVNCRCDRNAIPKEN